MSELSEDQKNIFEAAAALSDEDKRAEYLDIACRGDPDLRRQIDSLLSADEQAGNFLRIPAAEKDERLGHLDDLSATSPRIGRYKLLQKIGEGGFGTVYMAEQRHPVDRRVALKVIKVGMDTKQVIGRFEAERQALAMMDHPNIAKVLDAGATETGRPYFVMELVRGVPITEFCDQNQLDVAARLELFIHVCNAVQHAHQKGIIHRDIKPSNVMVTLHDDRPVPKVIDFGIAKATQQRLTERTVFTDFHQFLGTPAYMSPEQATLTGLDIDTRSDVYSLGVLLYELLTGTTPYDQEKLRGLACDELCRVIREDRPPTPSSRVSALGDQLAEICRSRSTEPGLLRRLLRGDVDWIVMKALEKDRARRYETANAMATDIRRHLNHEPVFAGPPSTLYRLRKYVQRNRLAVVSAAIVMLALLLGTVAATVGFVQARRISEEYRRSLYLSDMNNATTAWDRANVGRVIELLERHVPDPRQKDLRGFEWYYLWRLTRRGAETPTLRHGWAVHSVDFAANGDRLATAGYADQVSVWDLRTLEEEQLRRAEEATKAVSFSPDGRYLAWSSLRGVKLRDLHTGTDEFLDADTQRVESVAFSPDGQLLAASCDSGQVKVWAVEGRSLRYTLNLGGYGTWLAYSPDGGTLACGDFRDVLLKFWDTRSGQELNFLKGDTLGAWNAAFSPTGDTLATASNTGKILLWDAKAGNQLGELQPSGAEVFSLAFSPDGALLASGGRDNSVKFWDVKKQKRVDTLRGHSSTVRCVKFSPDGRKVASASDDQTVKLWDVATIKPEFVETGGTVFRLAFSPRGDWMAANGFDGGIIELWDPRSGKKLDTIRVHPELILSLDVSPDGGTIVAGTDNGELVVLDVESRQVKQRIVGHERLISSVRISPLNKVASASDDGTVKIWALGSGQLEKTLRSDGHPMEGLSFSSDGKLLATGNSRLRLWDVDTWQMAELEGHTGYSVAFAPDGTTLATGGNDSRVMLWKVARHAAQGRPLATPYRSLAGHSRPVSALGFSPDGRTLASGSTDNTVMLWDVASGEPRATYTEHTLMVHCVIFSSDGRTLVSCGNEDMLFFRRAASPEEVLATGQKTSVRL
jgi:WD40 repeat protein/serine/threonine protein kinase